MIVGGCASPEQQFDIFKRDGWIQGQKIYFFLSVGSVLWMIGQGGKGCATYKSLGPELPGCSYKDREPLQRAGNVLYN